MQETQPSSLLHIPVLYKEVPEVLIHNSDGVYVDGTFGRGGHSRIILSKLSNQGRLIAFDRDPEAIASAKNILDPRFSIIHAPFAEMKNELDLRSEGLVDGIFLDIGISSPQIDDPQRGFSFRFNGPLDMRMDNSCGLTASQWLETAEEQEIAKVIKEYGEEKFASKIARTIVQYREKAKLETTEDLANLVATIVPRNRKDQGQHPATRTFQAIRIAINDELGQLKRALNVAGSMLKPGGILAVISFHSLEDRIVKRFFDSMVNPARHIDPRLPLLPDQLPKALFERSSRILPSEEEKDVNPRARSSVMRFARRTSEPWRETK
ncbi:MAG: 16S rRNA (cytosine(1402)-N(4))-methyltransferase RsmH [Burkholderiaceae bacterium]|nr:16S rRNA (cytosine(1402)-N(4))-methyltransferase RsmH [Burkholderiaceae bacterium]